MVRYKLKIYHTSGPNAGYLDREEYFPTFLDAEKRYSELFRYKLYALNPTIWETSDGTTWKLVY